MTESVPYKITKVHAEQQGQSLPPHTKDGHGHKHPPYDERDGIRYELQLTNGSRHIDIDTHSLTRDQLVVA